MVLALMPPVTVDPPVTVIPFAPQYPMLVSAEITFEAMSPTVDAVST